MLDVPPEEDAPDERAPPGKARPDEPIPPITPSRTNPEEARP